MVEGKGIKKGKGKGIKKGKGKGRGKVGNFPWQGTHVESGARLHIAARTDRKPLLGLFENGKLVMTLLFSACGAHVRVRMANTVVMIIITVTVSIVNISSNNSSSAGISNNVSTSISISIRFCTSFFALLISLTLVVLLI
jgi:hypothetical protein